MNFKEIAIDDLIVNPSNDRHGPTTNEETAIEWLFNNKAKEMKKLATSIVANGRIFDSPLAFPDGKKYLVKDGNRRVTCLKLILEPSRAPHKYRSFFADLASEASGKLSKTVFCQIEREEATADEIIRLRHNGTQEGAGQLMWGPREKANHANRVKVKSDYEWPQLVENYLIEHGYANEASTIKRSTLDRILKAEKRRKQLGIAQDKNGKLCAAAKGFDLTSMLLRFVKDMKSNRLTLKETLRAEDINAYLSDLQAEGLLPAAKKRVQVTKLDTSPSKRRQTTRNTLIPRHINYSFRWVEGQTKIEMAWSQLQSGLSLEQNKFSVSVMLRTLLEISVKSFLDRQEIKSKGALAKDLNTALTEFERNGALEPKEAEDIRRILHSGQSSISIENLQRILHSKSQVPSTDDLVAMWDCLEPLVVQIIKSPQTKYGT